MAVIYPVMSYSLKCKVPGHIYDSNLASFGSYLFPWLGVSANAAVIRNLSFTLEDTAESAAKAKSLDSLAKVVLNKITFNYLLAEQGVCALASTTYCSWMTLLGKVILS